MFTGIRAAPSVAVPLGVASSPLFQGATIKKFEAILEEPAQCGVPRDDVPSRLQLLASTRIDAILKRQSNVTNVLPPLFWAV